jgi:hypothetical protein
MFILEEFRESVTDFVSINNDDDNRDDDDDKDADDESDNGG